MQNRNRKHIFEFNPDVEIFNRDCQDLLNFDAGAGYENFNDFIQKEANDFCLSGDGTTHVIWNILREKREIVGFYTLAATSIPYTDRIVKDPLDRVGPDDLYDDKICGISAIELKMFAVSSKYQDTFYEFESEDLPIAAWILRFIVDHVERIIADAIGAKAIFLHAVPEAEGFYIKNKFVPMLENMHPLGGLDDDFTPMYMPIRDLVINYETK